MGWEEGDREKIKSLHYFVFIIYKEVSKTISVFLTNHVTHFLKISQRSLSHSKVLLTPLKLRSGSCQCLGVSLACNNNWMEFSGIMEEFCTLIVVVFIQIYIHAIKFK